MDYQQILNSVAGQNAYGGATANPILMPRMQITKVAGEEGARNLAMGPDSTCFAFDTTHSMVGWFVQTDSAGNKIAVSGYSLTPYVPKQPPDFNRMEEMLSSMAHKMDDLSSRVQTMEEALK